jgi:hypothetical protein
MIAITILAAIGGFMTWLQVRHFQAVERHFHEMARLMSEAVTLLREQRVIALDETNSYERSS